MKIVIVGNGPGGVELAKQLSEEHEVTIVERETVPYYTKPMLSHYVAGLAEEKSLFPYPPDWYEKKGIRLLLGTNAKRIDSEKKILETDRGTLEYDVLVLATGAKPRTLKIPGWERMYTLRTIEDAKRLKEAVEREKDLLIIGGGFIGLEIAGNLSKQGIKVKVVEKMTRLMGLDEELTERIKKELEKHKVEFYLGRDVERIENDVLVTDKEEIPAKVILCSIGIVSEVSLAKESGLDVNRGILVDKKFRTSKPDIYAIGDCAEYEGIICGTAKAAMAHARVLANTLKGIPDEYDFRFRSSYFKFGDFPIAIVGELTDRGEWIDSETKAFYRDEKIVGVVVLSDVRKAREWEERLRNAR
ncbi:MULTISPECIES: NAD(P)/FAD-dependent oxidoreductase [unclassified Thermotoga]|uniref:NAD(P)/FAD-dependent oxidoreductase n=1 Tax=unclassified Thermotoga TaxID=2631113 RepID=UPI000540EB98|nr:MULTISPECIES: FAD/NAD(P)-binding oxidoreductase [unclassified Thermotoga]AIY87541.1 FAD-dependent pyridine nucleotide-disulfide oxidoreductase [Thermotoga sp. Cell2]KHC92470.1 FAD-dependent pyridine nucleotide-disulfide oxidoreductase [Thermotoga sp. TBGT1765]KHC93862.1 FAD-dependent pyridine nucleotide-disulfide oxidoreductase [Thermotoga sp. TBGT1766]KHC96516.1 FAD-dependent pyridine nucleotide-disulfide oxidoreductase [Thermotoga sp. Xyl54]